MKKVFLLAVLAVLFAGCTDDEYTLFGTISGTVTDINTGEPIGNVSLTLSPSGKTSVTGSDGNYEFVDLQATQYKIQARHIDYKTDTKTVNVLAGETARGDMSLSPKD